MLFAILHVKLVAMFQHAAMFMALMVVTAAEDQPIAIDEDVNLFESFKSLNHG